MIAEYSDTYTIVFIYDAAGSPIGMRYRSASFASEVWETYWYEKNLQGDIIAIYSNDGVKLISYIYDAWGSFTTTYHNGGASTTAAKNPFKYRGYYYDSDLGLYYLRSRYYDPVTGRFINADKVINGNGDLIGYNLYTYCSNNPVMFLDTTGENIIELLNHILDTRRREKEVERQQYEQFFFAIKEDVENFDWNNSDEQKVLDAKLFSSYKGTLVLRTPDDSALSFGVIVLGVDSSADYNTVKHEYGHKLQLEKMGIKKYILEVAIPSVTAWTLQRKGLLPYDYYTSPWEAEADFLGGVKRNNLGIYWNQNEHNLLELFDILWGN